MIQTPDGRWWGRRTQVATQVGVRPDRVTDWVRRGLVQPVDGWYPLDQVIEVEHATRTSGRGRPRDTPSQPG